MKSLKDFIARDKLEEDIDGMPGVFTSKPSDPPQILIMRRKSIREFPNGQRVANKFKRDQVVDSKTGTGNKPKMVSYKPKKKNESVNENLRNLLLKKVVGYYSNFKNELNRIAKEKFYQNQGEYNSIQEYIETWSKVKDGIETMLNKVEL